ncbi:hypothetical protein GCM10011348_22160 [Marinobacterium nitratireducens]|uniref:Uncharacterized protein n=1 Tax=Marinobacterium nitratireducens TaxID=518897 RepID=A0A917ZFC1_9GAMM|nr:hypothetical protein [Marinobacterium nitratireducens]GGO81955.1 hypothetical protein GCM10011348_22160 [Marinobacterium nitratireducens]
MNPWLQKIGQRTQHGTDKTDITPFVSFVDQSPGAFSENWRLSEPYEDAPGHYRLVEPGADETQPRLLFAEDLQDLPLLKDDRDFVNRLLGRCSMNQRHDRLSHYHDLWVKAHAQEPLAHRRENAGRYAANSWLLTQAK